MSVVRNGGTKSKVCLFTMVAIIAGLFGGPVYRCAAEDDKRPFTVEDSIGISYIINSAASTVVQLGDELPSGKPIFSPNGQSFLLVTQRGVVSTNTLEATIWLFDRQRVRNYVAGTDTGRPSPVAVVTLRSSSNTPVICDVRWLDSNRIAFLGKKGTPYQQLFLADVRSETVTAITEANAYVTAYDVSGNVIAYSTLVTEPVPDRHDDLVDLTGKNIYSLLYPDMERLEDFGKLALLSYPSELHIKRNGHEVPISLTWLGNPLRLFLPALSISPDGKSLITVAPVYTIPANWQEYQPAWGSTRYKPGDKLAVGTNNVRRAEQYVLVDLVTGRISPIVNAPAGRGLVYQAPTTAFWSADGREAILSNTFLPLDSADNQKERSESCQGSVVAAVDIASRKTQIISCIVQSPWNAQIWYRVSTVAWNERSKEITLHYIGGPEPNSPQIPRSVTYVRKSQRWVKISAPHLQGEGEPRLDTELTVNETVNQAPVLTGRFPIGSTSVIVWDPNPQLAQLRVGTVSIYHWSDKKGNSWSGLLALPPDYDSKSRYPMVIQTYGYDTNKYFADGAWTTGYGGRALAAKGIIVLQAQRAERHMDSPMEGPDQIDLFESAIGQLSASGLVDSHRVGIIGFSRTCFHVLYAMTHRPDLFAAASITDGVNLSYMQYMLAGDSAGGYQEFAEKVNGAAPFDTGLTSWIRSAPGFNLFRVNSPLLISAFERGQLITQWEIYSGLRRLHKPVDMLWWKKENTPHLLVQPAQRYASQQTTVDWFDFWLNDHEDADSSKAEQYARWREIRKNYRERTPLGQISD